MRLIDADTLWQYIDKHTNDNNQLDNDITCILEEVPTAYDVGKVIEQVHEVCYYGGLDDDDMEEINEIIGQGGIR